MHGALRHGMGGILTLTLALNLTPTLTITLTSNLNPTLTLTLSRTRLAGVALRDGALRHGMRGVLTLTLTLT